MQLDIGDAETHSRVEGIRWHVRTAETVSALILLRVGRNSTEWYLLWPKNVSAAELCCRGAIESVYVEQPMATQIIPQSVNNG